MEKDDSIVSAMAIAGELGIKRDAVMGYAKRREDPLPLRVIKGRRRGAFAFRSEFLEWVGRNSCEVTEKECYSDDG